MWCSYCCTAQLDLIKHSFGAHSVESTFMCQCGISGCLHQFQSGSTFYSFKSHADRKHPHWRVNINGFIQHQLPTMPPTPPTPPTVLQHQNLSLDNEREQTFLVTSDIGSLNDCCTLEKENAPSPKHTAALFILTLQEKYKLSQKAINFAVGSINTIVESVHDSIQVSVQNSEGTDIIPSFDYDDPFSDLQTEHQQSKFYREEFGLVVR